MNFDTADKALPLLPSLLSIEFYFEKQMLSTEEKSHKPD